jgi:hypothetical protein
MSHFHSKQTLLFLVPVTEDDGDVVAAYIPAVDCIIRLGQFLTQLQTVQI